MDRDHAVLVVLGLVAVLALPGCQSPYRSDQGALLGGLGGAGLGAVVGSATGHAGAGAAIGAGVGALSGAVVGSEMDSMEAKNRALIEQKLGRQVPAGAVSVNEVVAMTRAGVDEELIANHVRTHGMAAPLQANDLIMLQQQGVSKRVIAVMQAPPPQPVQPVVVQQAPPPVIVQEYGPPPPPYWYYRHRYPPPRPGVSWGVSVGN